MDCRVKRLFLCVGGFVWPDRGIQGEGGMITLLLVGMSCVGLGLNVTVTSWFDVFRHVYVK